VCSEQQPPPLGSVYRSNHPGCQPAIRLQGLAPQEQAVGSPADCLLGHVLVGGGDQERRKVKAGCLAGTSGPGSSSGRTIRVDRDGDGSVLLLG